MFARTHRRQIILFLIAVMIPSLVLTALSLRIISQERELAEKRLAEDDRRLVSRVRQELLARLERIKFEQVNALSIQTGGLHRGDYSNPAVVMVGQAVHDRLLLPWEANPAAGLSAELLREPAFAVAIERGEQAEFADRQYEQAAQFYSRALSSARHQVQTAYAELWLARALMKAGHVDKANARYRAILDSGPEAADEQGIPLSLYAAERLVEGNVELQAVLEHIRSEAASARQLSPAGSYMLRDLAGRIAERADGTPLGKAADDLRRELVEELGAVEQLLALQDAFPALARAHGLTGGSNTADLPWVTYGKEPWLVSLAPFPGDARPAAIVVRGDEVLSSVETMDPHEAHLLGRARLVADAEAKGEWLGAGFPGLKLALAEKDDGAMASQWNLQRYYYFVALILVLTVTLFGAYLLWRDVRRELRLAEMRSQFVSSVSHELRTPLTSIRMFAETLRMGRSIDPAARDEYLDTIVNESERLTRLLNNVLDFSRIERGEKTYHFAPTSLAQVVRNSARALEYPLAQQGFDLCVDVEDGLPSVRADGDALQQAILNLLTNAMKYSAASREIGLRLQSSNGRAVIRVRDRGLGIAPEEQGKIFEKFYRIPTAAGTHVPGTGLGLTLVQHIAKAHGGYVEVDSTPGRGSTFSIHLPAGRGE